MSDGEQLVTQISLTNWPLICETTVRWITRDAVSVVRRGQSLELQEFEVKSKRRSFSREIARVDVFQVQQFIPWPGSEVIEESHPAILEETRVESERVQSVFVGESSDGFKCNEGSLHF